jgi:sugar/nucleoside kinase (ribokinase family)
MPGVLCSGNLVCDLLVRPVDRMVWGTTTLVESLEQHLGGNGSNTSYTLGKLGVRVRLLGVAGRDAFGDYALGQLASAGVDTGGVRRTEAPTAATVVLVRTGGERLFLHRIGCGAEMELTSDEFGRECAGFSHYHLASPFGLPRLRPRQPELLRRAREAGLTTSIDTHWDSSGRWLEDLAPCLPHTDILFVNEDEARMLAGNHDPAAELREAGARAVVLKLGARGCAVFTGEGEIRCPAYDVPAVDSTGAGDCFVGGFLAALATGTNHAGAARFANAVAALSIQRLGAVEGVLPYAETLAWMSAKEG